MCFCFPRTTQRCCDISIFLNFLPASFRLQNLKNLKHRKTCCCATFVFRFGFPPLCGKPVNNLEPRCLQTFIQSFSREKSFWLADYKRRAKQQQLFNGEKKTIGVLMAKVFLTFKTLKFEKKLIAELVSCVPFLFDF